MTKRFTSPFAFLLLCAPFESSAVSQCSWALYSCIGWTGLPTLHGTEKESSRRVCKCPLLLQPACPHTLHSVSFSANPGVFAPERHINTWTCFVANTDKLPVLHSFVFLFSFCSLFQCIQPFSPSFLAIVESENAVIDDTWDNANLQWMAQRCFLFS
jgi:hypothetical protein